MRSNPIPAVVLFYSTLALILAVIMIYVGGSSLIGAGAEALSSACENLALITIAIAVWSPRR